MGNTCIAQSGCRFSMRRADKVIQWMHAYAVIEATNRGNDR